MRQSVVELFDSGKYPDQIARELNVSLSTVYNALRTERSGRKRKPLPKKSDLPRQIRVLSEKGYARPRIAFLLGVSRAYVYKALSDAETLNRN